ncbi:MAG: hypothetical protein QG578_358 [Thermodesulfobacteriota bacterium]|nr:hypothetical protein [Thermodesulfobacteriota bacterium]
MEKIKVIHIITRLDKGGSAENTLLTVEGLDKKIYDILLVKGLSIESGMTEDEAMAVEKSIRDAESKGVRILTVPGLVRKPDPFSDFKTFIELIKILRHEKPHIVHTHTSKAGILGRWAAFFAGVPIIIHTPHGHVFWGYFGRFKTSFYTILEKVAAFITDKIITLTEQEKNDHLRFRIAPMDKFSVVHSGIRLDGFSDPPVDPAVIRRKLGIPEKGLVIGTAGRHAAVKGQRYLIEAAVNITEAKPDTMFVFLGAGELSEELEDMALKLGVMEKVKFPGWRPDVAEVMSVFDLFVLPSLNEGMGRVLVEAMALGKPVVASNVGGIPDLVDHGKTGYLVPPGDVRSLSAAICDIIENPEKGKKMGENGKKKAAGYSADAMVMKIDKLYRALLQQKNIT